jgi:hypothetical protein
MKKTVFFLCLILMFTSVHPQTLYVDPAKGSDASAGTDISPLASLQKAVELARDFSGDQPVTIRIAPGLYTLIGPLKIETRNGSNDAALYTLEALIMPDDTAWNPYKMPVITSIANDNNKRYFLHCSGIFVGRANVSIRGLKFTGNPNPSVLYYYPIVRDSLTLNNLSLSQCIFVGEKNSAPIQGAMYVEGPGIHVDHCIFYDCKNAVLAFEKMKDFSVTHSIIYGAYECAVWYGWRDQVNQPFTFSHNIITKGNYFWYNVSMLPSPTPPGVFEHCLISDNEGFAETGGKNGYVKMDAPFTENDVRKTGKVQLVEVKTEQIPHDYLNLVPGSEGSDIDAGLFMKAP